MKIRYRYLGLLIMSVIISSCQPETSQNDATNSQSTQPMLDTPSSSQVDAREKIQNLLLSYYNDLSAKVLDEEQYFAPTVSKFYGQQNQSRERVGNIIRNGFDNIAKRSITLDRSSLEITPNENGYIAIFEGSLDQTRKDASQTQERFKNRVIFNKEFQIVSYELLDSQELEAQTNAPAAIARQQTEMSVADELLGIISAGDYTRLNQYIHPELGYYYITRPGAIDAVFHFSKAEDMATKARTPWIEERFKKLSCSLQLETLPEFSCEGFEKDGCFLAPAKNYERVSKLMSNLQEYDITDFKEGEKEAATKLEQFVMYQLVVTNEYFSFAIGQVEGKWYLLVVDPAQYDCSA